MGEIDAVEPGAPGRDTVCEQIAAITECLEVIAQADAHLKVYEHRALQMEDVRNARSVVLVATQLVINWVGVSVGNSHGFGGSSRFGTISTHRSARFSSVTAGYIIVDEIL
ncbi:MAG TPA: hypothetical protein VNN08_12230 [Thermoanaerobaculia bacterium]|nr:hypothetical protein [Thermoanaerobaculia bacterium]